ncbi:MAG: NAD-dependent epimerase/dehydratase family protein [Gammaproteobacteria bacterium]
MASTDLSGKTCLVTGASGFIGSYLCNELVRQGAKVKALLHSESSGNWDSSFVCVLGKQQIPNHVMQDVSVIFHLAGRAHSLSDCVHQDQLYYETNVEGTRNLLEAARNTNVSKFIYFSSVKSMGEESDIRLDEHSEPKPLSTYGKSKLEAEQLVLGGEYLLSSTVLRLTMVYGDSDKGNLPKMIKAISKNWFPPFPKIENKRSMIHVEDVVQAAIKVAETEISAGEVYILSDGTDYSTRQIYENIRKTLGKKIPQWGIPLSALSAIANTGDVLKRITRRRVLFDSDNLQKLIGNSYYSSQKIKTELGFSPKFTLFDAMPKIIANLKIK